MGNFQYVPENYLNEGENIADSKYVSESCKKEYFSLAKKNINNSLKKVKSTMLNSDTSSEANEQWGFYLIEKFKHFQKQRKEKSYITDIIHYIDSFQETNESKHIYNLSLFLAQELDEHTFQKGDRSSIIDKFFFDEKSFSDLPSESSLSKDEIFWRGTEFIICDLESFEHPLNKIIKAINMYMSDYYEKILNIIKNKILIQNKLKKHENKNDLNESLNSNSVNNSNSLSNSNNQLKQQNSLHYEALEDDETPNTHFFPKLNFINEGNYSYNTKNFLLNLKENEEALYFTSDNNVIETNIYLEDLTKLYSDLREDVMTISLILVETLIKFYDIKHHISIKIFDIFSEKIKDLIIRGSLYNIIYQIKSRIKLKSSSFYNEKLLEFYHILPIDLGVSVYFSNCEEFKKILDNKYKEFKNESNWSNESKNEIKLDLTEDNLGKEDKINIIANKNDNDSKEIILKQHNERAIPFLNIISLPFSKSILFFRSIISVDSIIQKIELIYQLRNNVFLEINEFWKTLPLNFKKRSVDADNLLSIFIYLLIKSQIPNIPLVLEIIDDFLNKNIKLSKKGYFFSLLQSSVEYVNSGSLTKSQIETNKKDFMTTMNEELLLAKSKPEEVFQV